MKLSLLATALAIVLASVEALPAGHRPPHRPDGGKHHHGGKIAIFGDYGWKYVFCFFYYYFLLFRI